MDDLAIRAGLTTGSNGKARVYEIEHNQRSIGIRFGTVYQIAIATTGAIIKSRLPDVKRDYALYLEGSDKDTLIDDGRTFDFEHDHNRFYTVPPATFGGEAV